MAAKPLFTTLGSNEDDSVVMLLVRFPGDRDFTWGTITVTQRETLDQCGVFDLTDDESA